MLMIDNILYQGCRSAVQDQFYRAEFEKLVEASKLTYRVARSRDGPEGVKRTYVQDLIAEDAEKLWDIIGKKGGWVYISGCVVVYSFVASPLSFMQHQIIEQNARWCESGTARGSGQTRWTDRERGR